MYMSSEANKDSMLFIVATTVAGCGIRVLLNAL
jgi:hypothetical protein